MKRLERIELIDIIGRQLQERMKFIEIESYLESYGISTKNHQPSYNSKYVYVKEILPKASDEIIIEIAKELGLSHSAITDTPYQESEATFWKPGHFRLFISHLASFKKTIGHLKFELEKFGISSFVAHEDIEPTKEWQVEIEKGLFSMDALCAVLMPGFKESNWTDQEIGIAIGRNVLIIPVRRELDPYGFIGKYQGFQGVGKSVDEVAEGIFEIIALNPKTKTKYLSTLVELIVLSNSASQGSERLTALKKIKEVPKENIITLQNRIPENKNLKNTNFLKLFNEIAWIYNLDGLSLKEFEPKRIEEIDDLPF